MLSPAAGIVTLVRLPQEENAAYPMLTTGSWAFGGCGSPLTIDCLGNAPQVDSTVFNGDNLATIELGMPRSPPAPW